MTRPGRPDTTGVILPDESFAAAVAAARDCRVCGGSMPHEPRPVFRVRPSARLLIIGQAPGARVHASGVPWNDPSGDRLRDWLGLTPPAFYDEDRVAILPMGFCYPGTVSGADLPPRTECAPLWQARLRRHLTAVRLTLLVGTYAQGWHLGARRGPDMTRTVQAFRDYLPTELPLPHPSWRNTAWLKRNPWFGAELVPELRRQVTAAMAG